ncbi:amidase [Rhodopila sp.]|uniref:amidase n=1 Tax=Rhodopila sp. TaxID=2480087 RepID=UPI003D1497B4
MDHLNAFVPGERCTIPGAAGGPLADLSFAVKDLIDVANWPTGGGNPDWARAHPVPERSAWVVQRLLDAGARIIGKTATDEVSLGILGENPFTGTPLNPAAPDRVPGGSSSGSASAVAGGACDFALGTDTGGSVRVPASFCGLFGLRPTHGRLNFRGITVQAPSSDTVGWLARDATTFARVGQVLFDETLPEMLPRTLLIASDAFAFADPAVAEALSPMVNRLADLIGTRRDETLAPQGLSVWKEAQRCLQSSESWRTFAPWVDRYNPRLQFSVARNLALAAQISDGERARAALMRLEARARLRMLLPPDTILCLPTTPFPAPMRGLSISDLALPRERITCLACVGGLTGSPQVNLPGARVDGAPVGLSLVGAPGTDTTLLAVANAFGESY